jgi:flagellar basal body-associated protein FliL
LVTTDPIADPLQHPLILVIVGAVITTVIGGLLVAWISKRWQDNKRKTEIRLELTQEMSEITAYAKSRILTAIAKYSRDKYMRKELGFSEADTTQLHKELSDWQIRSSVLASKLKGYFPSSDLDEQWDEYATLMVNVRELATRIYNTATRSDQVNVFLEYQENNWKDRLSNVEWSKVKNFEIDALKTLSYTVFAYSQVVIVGRILKAPMRKF